ncbi:hypothetical protein KJ707_03220 [Patescibacteria group bacterium]|nr:hypothetical protein [Patescibacteria group bacterium]MBU1967272.1 hypothetical protein [Patescibacteria group bacterium]MBU2543548.1 hypothetical protein [Patescibacteria group bacterium]
MYSSRNTYKQKILLEQNKHIFSSTDLAVLWEIENKNTLWTTLKRYTQNQVLYRLHKGLYSTLPINKLNPLEVGCALSGPSAYVSAETVLQNQGIIMQNINKITLFGPKQKKFSLGRDEYWCRYLNFKYLLNRAGIIERETYSIATPARAVADLLHLNPIYYFDNQLAVAKLNTKQIQQKLGY